MEDLPGRMTLQEKVAQMATFFVGGPGGLLNDIPEGESRTVEFTLGPRHLSLLDRHLEPVVEPGTFEVTVGGLKGTLGPLMAGPPRPNTSGVLNQGC